MKHPRDEKEETTKSKKHVIDAEIIRQGKPYRSSLLRPVVDPRHRDVLPEMSSAFKNKQLDYVFFLVSHGGGVDKGDKTVHRPHDDPPFGFHSNCDVVFQTSYGMCLHVANCANIQNEVIQKWKHSTLSGGTLIQSLNDMNSFTEKEFRQYDAYNGLVPNHYIFTAGNIYDRNCIIIYDVKTRTFLKDSKKNANIMLNKNALSSLKLAKNKQLRVRKKHKKRATHKYKKSTYVRMHEREREPTLFDLCNAHNGTLRQLNFADKDFSSSEIAFVILTCRVIGNKYIAHHSPTSWSTVSSQNSQNSQNGLGILGLGESGHDPVFIPGDDGPAYNPAFNDGPVLSGLGSDVLSRHAAIFNAPYNGHGYGYGYGGKGKHRKTHHATKKHHNRRNKTTKKRRIRK